MRTRPFRLLFASIVVVGLVAGACSKDPSTPTGGASATTQPPSNPVSGGAVSFGIIGSPDGFSPGNNRWTPATYQIAKSVYDPLGVLGADGKVHPYLAESFAMG